MRFLSHDILVIIGGTITISSRRKFISRNYRIESNTSTIEARSTMTWNGSRERTMVELETRLKNWFLYPWCNHQMLKLFDNSPSFWKK